MVGPWPPWPSWPPPKRKVEKKIHGECPLVNTTHTRLSCENFFFESLDRGVAMVAMVAIDDRTRIASSRRPHPPSCGVF